MRNLITSTICLSVLILIFYFYNTTKNQYEPTMLKRDVSYLYDRFPGYKKGFAEARIFSVYIFEDVRNVEILCLIDSKGLEETITPWVLRKEEIGDLLNYPYVDLLSSFKGDVKFCEKGYTLYVLDHNIFSGPVDVLISNDGCAFSYSWISKVSE